MRRLLACLALASPLLATAALADEDQPPAPRVVMERGAHGERVYHVLDAMVVSRQQPVFLILYPTPVGYDFPAMTQDFLPRITDAVRRSPF